MSAAGNSAINDVQQPTIKSEEQSLLSMSNNTPADSRDMYNNNDGNCNGNTTNTTNEQQEHRP